MSIMNWVNQDQINRNLDRTAVRNYPLGYDHLSDFDSDEATAPMRRTLSRPPMPAAAWTPDPVSPPPLTSGPPALNATAAPNPISDIVSPASLKVQNLQNYGGMSAPAGPSTDPDRPDSPAELSAKISAASAQFPKPEMYQRGGIRRVLGTAIQALSPWAAAFGIDPEMVHRGGAALSTPGYQSAMDDWQRTVGGLMEREKVGQAQQKIDVDAGYKDAVLANTVANRDRLAFDRDEARQQREQAQRLDEIELAHRKGWREAPTFSSPSLSIPKSTMPVEGNNNLPLPPSSMAIPGQTFRMPTPEGFVPMDVPRSRISPERIAGMVPTDATLALERRAAQRDATTEVVPKVLRDYFAKKGESLPESMPLDQQQRYLDIYKTETGQDVTQRGQDIRVFAGEQGGNRAREAALRKDVMGISKEFLPMYNSYRQIAGADPANAKSQLSAIYAYIKLLDPGSVVREGEVKLAQSTNPTTQYLKNLYEKVWTGTLMTKEEAKKMIDEAKRIYGAPATTFATRIRSIAEESDATGLRTPYILAGSLPVEELDKPNPNASISDNPNEVPPVLAMQASKGQAGIGSGVQSAIAAQLPGRKILKVTKIQ